MNQSIILLFELLNIVNKNNTYRGGKTLKVFLNIDKYI